MWHYWEHVLFCHHSWGDFRRDVWFLSIVFDEIWNLMMSYKEWRIWTCLPPLLTSLPLPQSYRVFLSPILSRHVGNGVRKIWIWVTKWIVSGLFFHWRRGEYSRLWICNFLNFGGKKGPYTYRGTFFCSGLSLLMDEVLTNNCKEQVLKRQPD